jgi:hypothetical protein
MTPPPAFTWTHLFPSAATYTCNGAPQWFAAQAANYLPKEPAMLRNGGANAPTDRYPVKIVWGDVNAIGPTASLDGIVAVNCRKFPVAKLRKSGFNYVRHFAALPNLENARWFVPLDSPTVSAAALSLYTPSRFSARLKRGAVRLAMRTRLPVWYRDHVWIAQRSCPPIETALNPHLHSPQVRFALSSGAPMGARNRKVSALALSPTGRLLAFAKIARSPIARAIAAHEADVLDRLERIPALWAGVPCLIISEEVDGDYLLAQSPLSGTPAPVAFTKAHRDFLAELQTPITVRAAATNMASDLPTRLLALSKAHPTLIETYYRTLPMLQKFDVPLTIVHGDFAPWNLRMHDGKIGAFDWEYGETSGLPLVDEMHYRLQSGWLLNQWKTDDAIQCLKSMAGKRPLGLRPTHVDAIAIVYLLDAVCRLLGEGYEEWDSVVTWHTNLLNRLSPNRARKEAIAA